MSRQESRQFLNVIRLVMENHADKVVARRQVRSVKAAGLVNEHAYLTCFVHREYDNGGDFSPPSAKAFLRIPVSPGYSPFDANMISNYDRQKQARFYDFSHFDGCCHPPLADSAFACRRSRAIMHPGVCRRSHSAGLLPRNVAIISKMLSLWRRNFGEFAASLYCGDTTGFI